MHEFGDEASRGRSALADSDVTQFLWPMPGEDCASGVANGIASVYAQGATAAIMIQENWDASVPTDVVNLLRKLIPPGVWLHDAQDGNGDAHLKAGLVGLSETMPVIDGELGLSRWQGIFFCEFDGPRHGRPIVCTVIADEVRGKG